MGLGCEVCGGLVEDGERVVLVRYGTARRGLAALFAGETDMVGGAYGAVHLSCLHQDMPVGDGPGIMVRQAALRLAGEEI